MHNRRSIIAAVAVVVLLVAGFFAYSQIHEKAARENEQNKIATPENSSKDKNITVTPDNKENKEDKKNQVKKSSIPQTDPTKGEVFIEGKVKMIDVDKRIITIEQHMDDNSKVIDPNVPVTKDAIIQDKSSDIPLTQIKKDDIVNMILTPEGQARAVLVNY